MSNAALLNSSPRRPQTLSQQQTSRCRTLGPLNSARARRPRRSHSACWDYDLCGTPIMSKPSAVASTSAAAAAHSARSKMRTSMSARPKPLSFGRTTKINNSEKSPTFLRFPNPGELVLSKCGSPLVASGIPGKFAHFYAA